MTWKICRQKPNYLEKHSQISSLDLHGYLSPFAACLACLDYRLLYLLLIVQYNGFFLLVKRLSMVLVCAPNTVIRSHLHICNVCMYVCMVHCSHSLCLTLYPLYPLRNISFEYDEGMTYFARDSAFGTESRAEIKHVFAITNHDWHSRQQVAMLRSSWQVIVWWDLPRWGSAAFLLWKVRKIPVGWELRCRSRKGTPSDQSSTGCFESAIDDIPSLKLHVRHYSVLCRNLPQIRHLQGLSQIKIPSNGFGHIVIYNNHTP